MSTESVFLRPEHGAVMVLAAQMVTFYVMVPAHHHPDDNHMDELVLMAVTALSLLLSVQMLVNVPMMDLPDIKDLGFLFPNLQ